MFEWDALNELAETQGALWSNGCHTYNGVNDQIPLEQATKETSSLKLVRVDELRLSVFAPNAAFGKSKRRVQAQFHFAANKYALWVTDPRIERTYLKEDDGIYQLGECYLTISLGEPFNNYCYKLVAAVMSKPR